MDLHHELNELIQEHRSVLEPDYLEMARVHGHGPFELGDQVPEVQPVLDLGFSIPCIFKVHELPQEHLWL